MRNLVANVLEERLLIEVSNDVDNTFSLSDEGLVLYSQGKLIKFSCSLGEEADRSEVDLTGLLEQENVAFDSKCAGIACLSDGSVVIALEVGVLLNVGGVENEVVGNLEAGLCGVWRSPDDELLLLATSDGALLLMTARDFEPLVEFSVAEGQTGVLDPVNVGWGAKETQFHGSAGKEAREVAKDAQKPVGPNDNRQVSAVWREDGQYFAVSQVCNDVRKIRVYSREGGLQSTSETVPQLGHCLAWKTLMASTVEMPNNKFIVAFFEKNGLRHGDFELPFQVGQAQVSQVSWNVDGSVLLVVCQEHKGHSSHVMLYVASNYKWQLKQGWQFGEQVVYADWDPVSPLSLNFVTMNNTWHRYELCWRIDHSLGKDSADQALVGVTDGRVLKMTPFRDAVVPPPISAYEVHVESNITQVVFAPPTHCQVNACLAISSDDHLYFIGPGHDDECLGNTKVTGSGGSGFAIKCQLTCPYKSIRLPGSCRLPNWTWLSSNILLASKFETGILVYTIVDGDSTTITLLHTIPCEAEVLNMAASPCGKEVAVQLINRQVLKLSFQDETYQLTPWCTLPVICRQMEIVLRSDRLKLVALSDRHRLHFDAVEVATGVTSFYVHSDYLLVTTTQHTLRCLPLESLFDNSKMVWHNESVRAVERGSRLVCSVSQGTRTVMQMPRGNLEAVNPRALSLYILKSLLDAKRYSEAMVILRKQRINLNLIVDHNPVKFLQGIPDFLQQIKDNQQLSVFIADLQNEDTTLTMYKSMYTMCKEEKHAWGCKSTKVDTVCSSLLEGMEVMDANRFFLPIISCLVRLSGTSSVESALLRIDKMRRDKTLNFEEALNFLLLLVDVNHLFDVALGLYDFDLVLWVASKSQKDPKEYLPFLNDLKKLPETYRKYKIDVHLKRYDSALTHIAEAISSDESYLEECLHLVTTQRLYAKGVKVFPKGSTAHQKLCQIYGDYLLTKRYYEEAALIYEQGLLLTEALDAWEQSLNWSYCLSLAPQVLSQPDYFNLCQRLADSLKCDRRYKEAAEVLTNYLSKHEDAVDVLVEGHCWTDAIRIAYKYQRKDLMETHVGPGIEAHAEETILSLDRHKVEFEEKLARLHVVLETKRKLAAGLHDEVADNVNLEDADLHSEVTSLASHGGMVVRKIKSNPGSIQTRQSDRSKTSSKNRRKQERKKYSTKEGSTFEDLGLVVALYDLINNIYKMTDDMGLLTRALVKINRQDEAKCIQQKLEQLLENIKEKEIAIWKPYSAENEEEQTNKYGPEATTADIIERANAIDTYVMQYSLLEPKYRIPPAKPSNADWKLQILY